MNCFLIGGAGPLLRRGLLAGIGLLIGLGALGGEAARAQTGPGGVGTTDGTSDQTLKIWLQGDEGVQTDATGVTDWLDQSGLGNDFTEASGPSEDNLGQPSTTNSPGFPVVRFTEPDTTTDGDAESLDSPDPGIQGDAGFTYFVVVDVTDPVVSETVDNTGGEAGNGTYVFDRTSGTDRVASLKVSDEKSNPPQFGFQKRDDNRNGLGGPTSDTPVSTTQGDFQVVGFQRDFGNEYRIFVDGQLGSTTPDNDGNLAPPAIRLGAHNENDGLDGDISEFVVYQGALNQAERILVQNYLAAKYSPRVTLAANDRYAFDGNHGGDVAGVGQASDGSQHLDAQSAQLRLRASGTVLSDGDFLLFGHDEAGASSFGFESTEPVGGTATDADGDGNPDAERIAREWRVDLTDITGPTTVEARIEGGDLPEKSSADYDYVVIVGERADFSMDPTVYDINDSGGGTFAGEITVGDGDYVTIGAVRRVVQFAGADGDASTVDGSALESVNPGDEGGSGETDATATLALNYPYTDGTTASVALAAGGTEAPAGNPGSDDFDAAGPGNKGSGSDGDGSNNDFDIGKSTPVSLSDTAPISLELHDDGTREQTQYVRIALDAGNTSGAAVGDNAGDGTVPFVFEITDDDEPRKLSFDAASRTVDEGEGGGTRTVSLPVNLNDVDDAGNDASASVPCTSVRFEVDRETSVDAAESTVITGAVSSEEVPDVQLADQSPGTSCDTEYQVRDADGEGGVLVFRENTTSATVEVVVNEDEINDFDTEDLVLDLTNPVSATVSSSNPLSTTLTLTDDPGAPDNDLAPDVEVSPATSSGDEGTGSSTFTVQTVRPSSPDAGSEGDPVPSSRPVEVPFAFDSASSTAGAGDFTIETTDPLTFDEGTTSKSVALSIIGDTEDEIDETVEIDLQSGSALKGATLGSPATHTYTIRDDDAPAIGSTGPGGVGDASVTPIWLRADAIEGVGDGADLATWADVSGNGNDASQSAPGQRPTYEQGVSTMNDRPVVRFEDPSEATTTEDGDGDFLDTPSPSIAPTSGYTYFVVADVEADVASGGAGDGDGTFVLDRPENVQSLVSLKVIDDNGPKLGYQTRYADGSGLGAAVSSTAPGPPLGSPRLVALQRDVGNQFRIFVDGNQEATFTDDGSDLDPPGLRIGSHATRDALDGDVPEVVVFSETLGEARRTIVENYLSAKYAVPLDGGDRYAGDQSGNGDYDRGVFGIGRTSASDFHSAAETDGLRFDAAAGLGNGDYLLAGHRTAANTATTSDINGLGGTIEARSARTWYTDVTNSGAGITVDVTVDLSEAGLSGPAGAAGNYVLLQRTADAADGTSWTPLQSGASGVSDGDEIAFNDVSLPDGAEITLGTTDAENSPLVTRELVITGNSSDADGQDQGWRYLGLPVTGGTAGDLHRADGSNFIDFRVDMAYTNPGGDVQGSGGGWTAVENSTVALPNGRGFILWLYDDADYPLDPSITLRTPLGLTGPGESNVTVGDGAPSGADPTLAQDDRQFLLANPYTVPFGLGSLEGSGFDSVVQVWEADATKGGNDISGADDENVGSFVTRSRSSNDPLAAWQGFLLTRTAPGSGDTQVTFRGGGRAPGATPAFVGSKTRAGRPTRHRIPLRLVGRDADSTLVALDRAASVLFRDGATAGRDRYDAPKLEPMTSAYAALAPVASEADSALRAQESRPLPEGGTARVPLSVQTEGVEGTFTIRIPEGGPTATETPSIPDDWTIQLVDRDLGTTHELTPGGGGYSFDVSRPGTTSRTSAAPRDSGTASVPRPTLRRLTLPTSAGGRTRKAGENTTEEATPRFVVEVQPADALPVEFTDLQAQRNGQRAVVEWRTAAETGNAGFQVQHQRLPAGDTTAAPSAAAWTTLGFVEGQGTTTAAQAYRYETQALDYGRHLFRLKQVDVDGTATTTEPTALEMRLQKPYAVGGPYPNPSRQQATLPVTVRETQRVTVVVYDLLGRRVRAVHERTIEGQQTKHISLSVRDLASGSYFLRVRGTEFSTVRRFTVVR